ncbi:MAG: lysylphosphatidylglycerol synthase domain-containing protein [Alphaproteobacteria bacterium]
MPRKKILLRLLSYAVTLAMLGYVFATVNFESIIGRYALLSWRDLLLLLFLMAVIILVGTLRLERLLTYFGNGQIRFVETFQANIAGLISSLVFINIIGSMLGRYYVLRRSGVCVDTHVAIVTLERMLLVLISGCLLAVGLVVLWGTPALLAAANEIALIEVMSVILLTILVTFLTFRWRREIAVFRRLLSARYSLRIGLLALLTLAAQGVMLSIYVISARNQGIIDIDWLHLAAAAAVVSFAAGLPISVNGWGVREVSAIYAFGHLGVSAVDATALSVLVGLVSTAAIVFSAPILALPRRTKAIVAQIPTSNYMGQPQSPGIAPANTAFLLFAGPLAALLVFITLHVPFHETLIAINLSDPLAILALALAVLSWLSTGPPPFRIPRAFGWWIAGLTLLILFGFLNGVARFGVTDWALNNRLFGWAILLGYLSLGAMMVATWGNHGLRRIAEVVLTAGAVITIFDLIHREVIGFFDVDIFVLSNFEGFSANRNAFAFQLLISASVGLAYSKLIARTRRATVYCPLLGAVFAGIWRTYSLTGLIAGICLVLGLMLFRMVDLRILVKSILWTVFIILAIWLIPWAIGFLLTGDSTSISTTAPNLYIPSSQAERWMSIKRGLEMWYQNPVFGAGLGAFADLRLGEHGQILVIHSVLIWLLAEFGVIGLFLVASLPVAVFIRALRWRLSSLPPPVVLLLAVVVCFTVFGLTHDIFYQRVFWLILGGCAAAWAGRRRNIVTRD